MSSSARSRSLAKRLSFAALPLGVAAGAFFLGVHVGERRIVGPLAEEFRINASQETLAGVLDARARLTAPKAYLDPAQVAGRLETISWAPPLCPTPFVGSAPVPGKHATVTIDALQFRDEREISVPRAPGVARVFLTGGSLAYSSGAPSEDRTIGAFLERVLRAGGHSVEVFTLACPGWASTHERIAIENRLSELEPDVVVSLSGVNDAHWGQRGRDLFWFRSYADHFAWTRFETDRALATGKSDHDVIHYTLTPVPERKVASVVRKNVELAAFALARRDARYVYALQPCVSVTAKKLSPREEAIRGTATLTSPDHPYFRACYDEIRRALRERDGFPASFEFADVSDAFDALSAEDELFLDSYHLGDRGNEILAKRLAAVVAARLPR